MRTLVVFCHPVPDSFGAALADVTVTVVSPDVRLVDLYDGRDLPRGFDPADEAALAWAEAVVLVYPTWWSSLPAPLMGWVEDGLDRQAWQHLSRVVAVTTHGSSRLLNAVTGGSGRRIIRRGLPRLMAPGASGRFIALYGMDTIDDAARHAFLAALPSELTLALA